MPCSNRKARLLLKEGKAKIYQYNPFTIQLCYATGEYMQECHIGIDTGSEHIGIAVTSEEKVLFKGEVELRQDVKSNLDTRRSYRRDRRNRKTRYRKARFLNRKKKESWLPPSIENRVNHTFKWINKLIALLPNPKLHIEVGKFDVAKMINPDIQGVDYQHGQTYGFYDMRYFVFARDNYTCQCCGKSKGKILQTHHIIYRSNGGSNRADNLITVCTDCHTYENHQKGGILYQWQEKHKKTKQYKEPSFMNVLRKRIFKKYPNAVITYGSETTPKRKELGLEKMHYNDAIIISGISTIKENPNEWLLIKQFRKKKRSLHEATARKGRKEPNRLQKRNAKNKPYYKGFYLNDKVEVFGRIGYITGFTSGGAHIKNAENEYIILPNKSYKQVGISNIKLLHHNNNWQYVNKRIS
ncbi:HNH endonuclease [Enterococcus cecorum]|nr:HNH endonuclease [Enterococcus cecorum]CAI3253333.1 HNH endonuclease [Enterococcus cecorum]CAI3257382.1 HNH endonuclease [Enterococcus cecorum]CAI3257783.1 HNH endonuclease [Enterococcus cecorum]CAI3260950.1 HNH endonuclease [Enterococcus cecorum]